MSETKTSEGKIEDRFKKGKGIKLPRSVVFWIAIVVMVSLVVVSFVCLLIWIKERKSNFDATGAMVINSLVACVGFIAIYINVENDKKIKKFEYIKDYNFQFLALEEFKKVECALESCNELYLKIKQKKNTVWTDEDKSDFTVKCEDIIKSAICEKTNDLNNSSFKYNNDKIISENYQSVVNYLVYLESFAPLLIHKQVDFDEIDDLFGYRFFIAVNNPALQKWELCREPEYYKGCINAYFSWKKYKKDQVPMQEFDLASQTCTFTVDYPDEKENQV